MIREDSCEGKLLDKFEQVSFVSLPAPNAFTTNQAGDKEYNDPDEQKGLGLHKRNLSVCDLTAIDTDTNFDAQYDQKRESLLEGLSDRITRALAAFALGGCTDLGEPWLGISTIVSFYLELMMHYSSVACFWLWCARQ